MTTGKYLSISDIQKELGAGTATVKFILKRFGKWIPHIYDSGMEKYPADSLPTLLLIQEQLDAGILPSDIERELDQPERADDPDPADRETLQPDPGQGAKPTEDIRFSPDSLDLIESLFSRIGAQQERIADAHEKRAQAEERKAVAIEKRAIAEEKKAQAMNNIAAALQEMSQSRNDFNAQQIASDAAAALITDEITDTGIEDAFAESRILEHPSDAFDAEDSDGLDDLNGLSDLIDSEIDEQLDQADLSTLLDDDVFETASVSEDIDDLSSLISETDDAAIDDLSMLTDDPVSQGMAADLDMDDLMLDEILDEIGMEHDTPSVETPVSEPGIDDLSLLISDPEPISLSEDDRMPDMDDLSQLIDDFDDLSLLVKPEMGPDPDMDNLSMLIDEPSGPDPSGDGAQAGAAMDTVMDDLSKLINGDPKTPGPNDSPKDFDDLSQLIDTPASPGQSDSSRPSLKPEITPQEDLEGYKKTVMNLIVQLKDQGLSVEETTQRFNDEGVLTLSGKDRWASKAIAQIYRFIDAAK